MTDRTCKSHRDATVTFGTRYAECPLCHLQKRIGDVSFDVFCSVELDEVLKNPEAFVDTAKRVADALEVVAWDSTNDRVDHVIEAD